MKHSGNKTLKNPPNYSALKKDIYFWIYLFVLPKISGHEEEPHQFQTEAACIVPFFLL